MGSRRRLVVWGVIVVSAYGAAAVWTHGRLPVRPIFDGFAPPAAYKYVSPPPGVSNAGTPSGASQALPLKPGGTDETSVATADGQATLILPQGSFGAHPPDKAVHVAITPKNPASYGSPPSRLAYEGNAYDVSASYQPSGARALPALTTTVLLSYPVNATKIMLRASGGWTATASTDVPASLQMFAKTKTLGVFVVVGTASSNSLQWWTLGIASGLAALLGLAFGLRERRRLAHGGR
jgi:hypothetical protein